MQCILLFFNYNFGVYRPLRRTPSDVSSEGAGIGVCPPPTLLGKTHYKNIPVSRSFLSHANLANHAKTHHFTRVCHPDGYIRAIAMYDFARFARFA